MAERPIYIPERKQLGVSIKPIEFHWFPGLSLAQKQRSIAALHAAAREAGYTPLLEISSKSPDSLGVAYGGFALHYCQNGMDMPIEAAAEGSKIFANGGPYLDIYADNAVEAHRDARLKNSGPIIGYEFMGKRLPAEPEDWFYDWLYIQSAHDRASTSAKLAKYQGFTDIEKNPKETLACQAWAAALYVSLCACGKIEEALKDMENFRRLTAPAYTARAAVKWA